MLTDEETKLILITIFLTHLRLLSSWVSIPSQNLDLRVSQLRVGGTFEAGGEDLHADCLRLLRVANGGLAQHSWGAHGRGRAAGGTS